MDTHSSSSSMRSSASNVARISKYAVSSKIKNLKAGFRPEASPPPPTPQTKDVAPAPAQPQSWRQWAGKIKDKWSPGENGPSSAIDYVHLFPGWAVRRPRQDSTALTAVPRPFDVDIYVAGFADSSRPLESLTRSQRAFLRLAKGFASLPKLAAEAALNASPYSHLSPSTEALLREKALPPRPADIDDDYEAKELDRRFEQANKDDNTEESATPSSHASSDGEYGDAPSSPQGVAEQMAVELVRWNKNLEERLQPFLSSALPARQVRIQVYASVEHLNARTSTVVPHDDTYMRPIATRIITTDAEGSFKCPLRIHWDDIQAHPAAQYIARDTESIEHYIHVIAELLPPSPASPHSPTSSLSSGKGDEHYKCTVTSHLHHHAPVTQQPTAHTHLSPLLTKIATPPEVYPHTSQRIPLTHSQIRVLSDIDDTVKMSNIMSGARVVFQSVFVKDLTEAKIPGMGEWYMHMFDQGVRFHYVSNGPFGLLPLLTKFFEISGLPLGSIRLRSYGRRSLFDGLLTDPATRKRTGVVDVLDSFPESRFFLIGDSGEQDLELYAEIAKQYPDRIIAIFIRDVEAGEGIEKLEDPTGMNPRITPPTPATTTATATANTSVTIPSGGSGPTRSGTSSSSSSGRSTPEHRTARQWTTGKIAAVKNIGRTNTGSPAPPPKSEQQLAPAALGALNNIAKGNLTPVIGVPPPPQVERMTSRPMTYEPTSDPAELEGSATVTQDLARQAQELTLDHDYDTSHPHSHRVPRKSPTSPPAYSYAQSFGAGVGSPPAWTPHAGTGEVLVASTHITHTSKTSVGVSPSSETLDRLQVTTTSTTTVSAMLHHDDHHHQPHHPHRSKTTPLPDTQAHVHSSSPMPGGLQPAQTFPVSTAQLKKVKEGGNGAGNGGVPIRELQVRAWKARKVVPEKIGFRVFRDPKECKSDIVRAGLNIHHDW
ncbi:hypothetical protein BDN72DRAFT_840591 [Pluteus cervinus]|uniref:Uncharacterized protein n=1 Tax=Pluteus cervinus TaxID=181527 RepID=A0ACD3ATM0_9AGAR|nr:hypothetical protein BDN72DRAFT_840591 [Pluteus cervinus]